MPSEEKEVSVKVGDFVIPTEDFEKLTGHKPKKMLKVLDALSGSESTAAEFQWYDFEKKNGPRELLQEGTPIELDCSDNSRLTIRSWMAGTAWVDIRYYLHWEK
jgi:hypothetical protein